MLDVHLLFDLYSIDNNGLLACRILFGIVFGDFILTYTFDTVDILCAELVCEELKERVDNAAAE